nr:hypothetical protein CFP56_62662 [Quercus suber]
MDGEAVTPFDPVVMAQQIQALTANVQELIKHNDELKRRARPEGVTLHFIGEVEASMTKKPAALRIARERV